MEDNGIQVRLSPYDDVTGEMRDDDDLMQWHNVLVDMRAR